MKNQELVEEFLDGADSGNGSHLFLAENVIFSYGYHFPIAIRLTDGYFIVNIDRYSVSTSSHQGYVRHGLEQRGWSNRVIKLNTKDMNKVIKEGIKTKKELVAWGV